jgi:BirA family transcriptional regulator, biotin operon repressor / biotin---[acetyl-CoA-carboxylase] ligase
MTARAKALLARLADGSLHSGADLADQLGVSRAAIWKLVAELRGHGIAVDSLPRRGYRLPAPVELLDAQRICGAAAARGLPLPATVEVLFEIDSTNTYLYAAASPPPGSARVAFAEIQHAGRGRRGRSWLAPFGSGLTFSVAWTFAETPPGLPALGLALGVAVAEALRGLGLDEVRLKWPNDIVWRHRKLGGLLLQVRTESGGPASVVAGLGLNLSLPPASREQLKSNGALPVADLAEAMAGNAPGRNAMAAILATALLAALDEFARCGFGAFAPRWARLDALAGARVRVTQGAGDVEGEARGADAEGALLVAVDGRIERFHSGDVSLRPATP